MALSTSYSTFTSKHSSKHPLVTAVYDVEIGDRLAVWNAVLGSEMLVDVTEKLWMSGTIEVRVIEGPRYSKDTLYLEPQDHTIYRLPFNNRVKPWETCSCGAKHTSFPNHHLFYCAKYKKDVG